MVRAFGLGIGLILFSTLGAMAQPAPPKPYTAVPVTIADETPKEASFVAFRKDLVQAVSRKDRAAVAKLVLPGFVWARDFGGGFDRAKSATANFEAAIGGLADGDFTALAPLVAQTRLSRDPQVKDAVCGPAAVRYEAAAFDKVLEQTDSDGLDWGVPVRAGVSVRAAPKADAPVVTTLPLALIRGLEWWADGTPTTKGWHRVMAPAGTVGFVASDDFMSLNEERLCYAKGADGRWGIAGYIGGGE